MTWIIILLLAYLGFLAWKDPEVKKTDDFKRTVKFVVGAIAGLGGSQVLAKFAITSRDEEWIFFSNFAEAAAWVCLVMAVLDLLKDRESPS